MVKFLDLKKQYEDIKDEIDLAIKSVINKSAFIGGEFVRSFEQNFAEYNNAKFCVGVGNGTDALEIAIEALNLPKESEIIVPANSFIASSECITRAGHKVVFCDCNEFNYTIDVDDITKRITNKTRAIIVVHLYGHPADMDPLIAIAKKYNLQIIEDCAQAHGAEYKGKRVGTFGVVSTFSFYPGKNLGAYGDAGAIITNNDEIAKKARMIANHGRIDKYNHEFVGRNSRLDGIQGAVLDVKLRHLNKWNSRRREVAELYRKGLKGCSLIVLPKKEEWATPVYHLFVIRIKNRDKIKEYLKENNIETGVHYPISLSKLKAYEYIRAEQASFKADKLGDQLLSLPINELLTDIEVETVIKFLYSGLEKYCNE